MELAPKPVIAKLSLSGASGATTKIIQNSDSHRRELRHLLYLSITAQPLHLKNVTWIASLYISHLRHMPWFKLHRGDITVVKSPSMGEAPSFKYDPSASVSIHWYILGGPGLLYPGGKLLGSTTAYPAYVSILISRGNATSDNYAVFDRTDVSALSSKHVEEVCWIWRLAEVVFVTLRRTLLNSSRNEEMRRREIGPNLSQII